MNNNQTFPRLCRVLEIYEADFGCEERPDGQETMVCVRLLDTTENANLSVLDYGGRQVHGARETNRRSFRG